jgi:hypothetical protein
MKLRKWNAVLALLCANALSPPALASESGLYVGASIGQSDFKIDDSSSQWASNLKDDLAIDNSDTNWSLAVGYRFVKYFGVEASYNDFGKASYSDGVALPAGSSPALYAVETDVSLTGWGVSGVLTVPVDQFEIGLKLGVLFADSALTGTGPGSSFAQSAGTTEMIVGLGIGYTFVEHYHLRADFTQVPNAGDQNKIGEGNVTAWTVGFQYRF